MSLPNLGFGSKTNHDQLGGTTYPRYMVMYAERKQTSDSTPNDEDPIFGFRGATTHTTGTEAKVYMGILNGVLPSPEHNITVSNLSAGIEIKTDRVIVKPGIIFNPQSAAGPAVNGSLYFDSDDGQLWLYSGGWTALTTGAGMTAHDLTGAYHTEDATGGAGNFLKADSATTFSWQAHGLGASDVGAYTTAQVDSAIDTDIATHAALGTVHQDAPGLIATHAAIATAHQDAPGLIATHTAIATAHQDAPGLIATHAAISGAHHSQSHVLSGGDHTATGLTVGWVISADSATTFSWKAPTIGSGTQWTLPVFDTTTTIGDSMVSQDSGGTLLTVGGDLKIEDDLYISQINAVFRVISSVTNKATSIRVHPTGTEDATSISACNAADTTNTGMAYLMIDGTTAYIGSFGAGTGTAPTTLNINDADWNAINIGDASCTVTLGDLNVLTLPAGVDDYNKFLVSDGGEIKFRTGAEVASDIGAAVTGEPHILATTGPHTGTLPWTDLSKTGSSLADLATRTHASLSDAPTSAHHVRYADSEAVSAVQAANPLTLTYDLSILGYNLGIGIAANPSYLIESQDADYRCRLGRAMIGHLTYSDYATFCHRDMSAAGQYALLQGALGSTYLNAATGKTVYFNVNHVTEMNLTASGLQMQAAGARIDEFSTDVNLVGNSDNVLVTEKAIKAYVDASSGGPGSGTPWDLAVWNAAGTGLTDSMISQNSGGTALTIGGTTTISTINAGTADYDKFLVSHTGLVKFRTGAEVLSDIGAVSDIAYASSWNGVTTIAPSKNAIHDTLMYRDDYPRFTMFRVANGASLATIHGHPIVNMPSGDADCECGATLIIPEHWPSSAATIKVLYMMGTASQIYSLRWYVSSHSSGEASGYNILSASTSYDFAAVGVALTFATLSVPLSGLSAGESLGFRLISDASNGTNLYIASAWLEA